MDPSNLTDVELVKEFNSTPKDDEVKLSRLAGEMDMRGISKNAVVETMPGGDMEYVNEDPSDDGSFLSQFDDTPVTEQLA